VSPIPYPCPFSTTMACPAQSEVKLKQDLATPLTALQETARRIAEVQSDCKLPVEADEFVESFKPTLMDVIFNWSKVGWDPLSSYMMPPKRCCNWDRTIINRIII